MKTGVLLLNVGTPKELSLPAVREYLRTFLMDPLVIGGPDILRSMLVKGIILPFRAPKTLERYRLIWDERGSPLAVNSKNLELEVQEQLGSQFVVRTGFCHGQFPIQNAIDEFRNSDCGQICLVPLFPQSALSTTTSCLNLARQLAEGFDRVFYTREFYNQGWFHNAWAEIISAQAGGVLQTPLVLSYHSLPVSHLQGQNPDYRAQCFATSEGIRRALNMSPGQVVTAFQSRLGYGRWIEPFTRDTIRTLGQLGHKKILVACPAFVADGLESLEEIGLELKGEAAKRGVEIELVPCLNDHTTWVKGLSRWVELQVEKENQSRGRKAYENSAPSPTSN